MHESRIPYYFLPSHIIGYLYTMLFPSFSRCLYR